MADEKKQDSSPGEKQAPVDKDKSRIELSDAETTDADAATEGKEPLSVRDVVADQSVAETAKKSQTSRIELDEAEKAEDGESVATGKDTTVRMDLTGAMRRMEESQSAEPEAEPEDKPGSDDERSNTARIALEGNASAPSAEPPRTVRLKRPSAPPRTVVMKKPAAGASSQEIEEDKGKTSRIQIPEGAIGESSSSARKTIRIKRSATPSASPARTLSIARPSKTKGPTLSAKADAVRQELESNVTDEPGSLFGILSMAAVLVLCALVYVLLAQTLFPTLPLTGRIL